MAWPELLKLDAPPDITAVKAQALYLDLSCAAPARGLVSMVLLSHGACGCTVTLRLLLQCMQEQVPSLQP